MLASGTRVRGFKPCRSRWIFRASEKSSACLPSEGKWKNLSHVPALRHVKELSTSGELRCASKIPYIVPSFASRGLSCLCCAWRLWRWMRRTQWGKGIIGLQGCSAERPHKRPYGVVNSFHDSSYKRPVLGAFPKITKKKTINFFISVRPSFCPHGTTMLPLNEFFVKFWYLRICRKTRRENSNFIKIG